MENRINTIEDVKSFFAQLAKEDLNFHPDTSFENYINVHTNQATYSKEEADARNHLLGQCFDICEQENVDTYELCSDVFNLLENRS